MRPTTTCRPQQGADSAPCYAPAARQYGNDNVISPALALALALAFAFAFACATAFATAASTFALKFFSGCKMVLLAGSPRRVTTATPTTRARWAR